MIKFEDLKIGQDVIDLYLSPNFEYIDVHKVKVLSITKKLPINCNKEILSEEPYLRISFLFRSGIDNVYYIDNYEFSTLKESSNYHRFYNNKKELKEDLSNILKEQLDKRCNELKEEYDNEIANVSKGIKKLEENLLAKLK